MKLYCTSAAVNIAVRRGWVGWLGECSLLLLFHNMETLSFANVAYRNCCFAQQPPQKWICWWKLYQSCFYEFRFGGPSLPEVHLIPIALLIIYPTIERETELRLDKGRQSKSEGFPQGSVTKNRRWWCRSTAYYWRLSSSGLKPISRSLSIAQSLTKLISWNNPLDKVGFIFVAGRIVSDTKIRGGGWVLGCVGRPNSISLVCAQTLGLSLVDPTEVTTFIRDYILTLCLIVDDREELLKSFWRSSGWMAGIFMNGCISAGALACFDLCP